MNAQEFAATVAADPHLSGPIERAARPGQFRMVGETAAVVLMFPIVKYVLVEIGLPWLYELKRYSELQRQKLHTWIDEQARRQGIDPEAAEAASDALCTSLEQTTDAAARSAWEQLARLLKTGTGEATD